MQEGEVLPNAEDWPAAPLKNGVLRVGEARDGSLWRGLRTLPGLRTLHRKGGRLRKTTVADAPEV